jgi:hypothetical protein
MKPGDVWIEPCEAARRIEDEFGTDKARGVLVGETFLYFPGAVEDHADFRAEVPAFAAEVGTIFGTLATGRVPPGRPSDGAVRPEPPRRG